MRAFQCAAAIAAFLLSACQINPPRTPSEAEACNIPKWILRAPQPDDPPGPVLQDTPDGRGRSFQERLGTLLNVRSGGMSEPPPPSLLFLSGGSQKGAFGAGFLKGWSERPGGLPRFDLVTGVSAGAILSTAAFIGDGTGAAEQFSRIERETDVLKPFAKRNSKGDFSLGGYASIAKRGAVADLAPMRARLVAYLKGTREGAAVSRIQEARNEAIGGRDLYVGAVDLDSGQFVAFDLGEYLRTRQALTDTVVDCYANAVLASSSVPMAALPVFIDGRIYVDGGARNGLFGMQLIDQLYRVAAARDASAVAPNLYLLVNGTQEIDPDCGAYRKQKLAPAGPSQAQDAFCRNVVGDPKAIPPRRPTWSLATVGLRSVDVLVNQVYRANAQATFQAYRLAYGTPDGFRFARMKEDAPDFLLGEHSCGSGAGYLAANGRPTWYDLDEKAYRPLEFYPNYMKCLIAYGEHRARQEGW